MINTESNRAELQQLNRLILELIYDIVVKGLQEELLMVAKEALVLVKETDDQRPFNLQISTYTLFEVIERSAEEGQLNEEMLNLMNDIKLNFLYGYLRNNPVPTSFANDKTLPGTKLTSSVFEDILDESPVYIK